MTSTTTKPDAVQPEAEAAVYLFDDWFDPIEAGLRDRVREWIEAMINGEFEAALGRPRYGRIPASERDEAAAVTGYRNGSRRRTDRRRDAVARHCARRRPRSPTPKRLCAARPQVALRKPAHEDGSQVGATQDS